MSKKAIGERHRQVREAMLGMSVPAYAQELGVKEVTVYSWEAGRTTVPHNVLAWLEQEHQVSAGWMLTGIGERISDIGDRGTGIRGQGEQRAVSSESDRGLLARIEDQLRGLHAVVEQLKAEAPEVLAPSPRRPLPRIPLLSLAVSAGVPTASDDTVEREIDLAEMLLEHPDSTYFIRVVGDSMTDAGISDGDTLIVDCALQARPGQVVIAKVFGELTVKRFLQVDGRPLLRAENRKYKDIEITEDMDFTIVGVVSSCIKKM